MGWGLRTPGRVVCNGSGPVVSDTRQTYMTLVKSLVVACCCSSGLGTHAGGASLSFVRDLRVLTDLPH